jgi:hypothetical protein
MGKIKEPKPDKGSKKIGTPTETHEVPTERRPPIFSLQYLRGDYCLTMCERVDRAAFAIKMHRLSQLTWSEIQSQHKHSLGYERIARNAIKSGIPAHIKPDVNFLAFRFSGKKPMVGYREGAIFYVIWLDRDFTLYDHG